MYKETTNIIYSLLLILSGFCLTIGGILLIGKIPYLLTISTFIVVLVLVTLAIMIIRGYTFSIHLGAILGIMAIISSATSTAHNIALLKFGSSLYITTLDILMVLGFYLFPAIYIFIWISQYVRKRREKQ